LGLKAWLTNDNLDSLKADTTVNTEDDYVAKYTIHIKLTH
jgi:hypothetical protein